MTVARHPSLAILVEKMIDNKMAHAHFCCPAQVVAYNVNDTPQTVDVRPCLDRTIMEEDREKSDPMPIIYAVPLMFPGSGSYRLTFPIAVNDYVLLVFADRSTDEFVTNGGVVEPADMRTHSISDAFAIPGVTPAPNALTGVVTSAMVIGKNGNTPQKAARQNDGVGAGTLQLWFNPGTGGATLGMVYTPGDGSAPQTAGATVAPATPIGSITIHEKITGGSNDVEIT